MDLTGIQQDLEKVKQAISKVIIGQDHVIQQLLACLLAGGHVLLEGVPGLGKTLLAKALAKLVHAQYKRIQFTPDLLPSDITGTLILNTQSMGFVFHKGPLFTEILLADEINRTPPKSQAALLEAMEERQVTVGGTKKNLPDLFFVMATQNPIEYEGTYPLPETQLDRFMMKIVIDYPEQKEEFRIIKSYTEGVELQDIEQLIKAPVMEKEALLQGRKELMGITVKDDIIRYIHAIVLASRDTTYTQLGASPRAAIAMLKAARASAALESRQFVTPEDIKDVAIPTLRHRVILKPEALIDGLTPDQFLGHILDRITVPR